MAAFGRTGGIMASIYGGSQALRRSEGTHKGRGCWRNTLRTAGGLAIVGAAAAGDAVVARWRQMPPSLQDGGRCRRGRRRPMGFIKQLSVQVLIGLLLAVVLGVVAPGTAVAVKPLGDGFSGLLRIWRRASSARWCWG